MQKEVKQQITIDLNQFKLQVNIQPKIAFSLHFDSPSRKFYLSLIAMTVYQMKKMGKVTSIPLETHYETIARLNETVGGSAGSSKKSKLFPRIYKKWKSDLPDLENAPLFRVLGKRKEYSDGMEKVYSFSDAEKDIWANLFSYKGSGLNVRLLFAIDTIGLDLDDITIVYGKKSNLHDEDAWEIFVNDLMPPSNENSGPSRIPIEPGDPDLEYCSQYKLKRSAWKKYALAIGVLFALATGGIAVYNYHNQSSSISGDPASIAKMSYPLPSEPSIVVLPFNNISGDPEQEYLADGITDNIITALSQVPEMFVIASNTAFSYKNSSVPISKVSEELGIKYVLEGSLQREGKILRVNVQLIDAIDGYHIWAKKYDRELKELFALQDEITVNVLTELQLKLTLGERVYELSLCTDNVDLYLRGLQLRELFYQFSMEGNLQIRNFLYEFIELEPECASSYVDIGWTHLIDVRMRYSESPEESLRLAEEWTHKGLTMKYDEPNAHSLLGVIYGIRKQYDIAIEEHKLATLNSINPQEYYHYASTLLDSGHPEESVKIFEMSIRRDPKAPAYIHGFLGCAYFHSGNYEKALLKFKNIHELIEAGKYTLSGPIFGGTSHLRLAATYSMLGKEKEAKDHVKQLFIVNPDFSFELWKSYWGNRYNRKADINCWIEALNKVGLN